jgi:hypothetical protein
VSTYFLGGHLSRHTLTGTVQTKRLLLSIDYAPRNFRDLLQEHKGECQRGGQKLIRWRPINTSRRGISNVG